METTSLTIAMIILSVFVGIGLLVITYHLILVQQNTNTLPNDSPISSSLEGNPDLLFITVPPPPMIKHNNHKATISEEVVNQTIDPVSASLVRQSLEERAGYYRDPSRKKPIPYYHQQQQQPANQPEEDRWSSYQVW